MNNIQNRNGSITEGKKPVAQAIQGPVIKGNKRFSLMVLYVEGKVR